MTANPADRFSPPPEAAPPADDAEEPPETADPWPLSLLIAVEDPAWEVLADPKQGESLDALLRRVVRAALVAGDPGGLDLPPGTPLEISLLLADDARVRALNLAYRGQDKPTNVLSFAALDADDADQSGDSEMDTDTDTVDTVPPDCAPLPRPPDQPVILGDIVLARETLLREAGDQSIPPRHHLMHLVAHGVLHLLGYDHETEEEAEAMEGLETRILAAWGVADPHAPTEGEADAP